MSLTLSWQRGRSWLSPWPLPSPCPPQPQVLRPGGCSQEGWPLTHDTPSLSPSGQEYQCLHREGPALPSLSYGTSSLDWELLGMHWKGGYYIDICLPFELRSAPFLFNEVATAVECILRHNYAIPHLIHYLDDYFMAGPP